MNGTIAGKGTATFADGSVYEGEFKEARNHGIGKITYADGHVYDGQWIEGVKQGRGF